MGKSEDSEKNSICEDDDDRARTPIVTGPIIELRGREVVFAISVFFLSAIVVGLIVVLASNKVKETAEVTETQRHERRLNELQNQHKLELATERKRYCLTPSCVRVANRLLNKIDISAKPCTDFWKYACGGWLERNDEGYGVEEALSEKIHKQMKLLLHKKSTRSFSKLEASADSFQSKVFSLYDSCTENTDEHGNDGTSLLNEILDDNGFGGWSVHDDWNLGEKSGKWQTQKALQILQFDYDVEAFFTVDVVPSIDLHLFNRTLDKAVTIRIGKLRASSWGLPDHSYYYKNSENMSEIVAYKTYMSTVASLFNVTENKTEEFVHNTFHLEKRLAQFVWP